ncbi:hypothetical protein YC2023_110893 [Brassica napus]
MLIACRVEERCRRPFDCSKITREVKRRRCEEGSEFQFLENAELCELKKKMLTRDLQHGTRNTVKRGSDRVAQVIQSGVNPRTTGRIVGCRIVLSLLSNFECIQHDKLCCKRDQYQMILSVRNEWCKC